METDAYQLGYKFGQSFVWILGLGLLALFILSLVKVCTAPRGRKGGWVVGLVISVLLLGGIGVVMALKVIGATQIALGNTDGPWTSIKSADKEFQLEVPASWKPLPEIPMEAKLKIGNLVAEQYCVVVSEPKALIEKPLDEVDALVYKETTEKTKTSGGEPKKTVINGLPAIERTFETTINRIKITYLRATLESKTNYHYISTWTLTPRAAKNLPVLERVVRSFAAKEGPPTAESKVEVEMVPVKNAELRVRTILAEQLEKPVEDIKPETALKDLGGDDLDLVELVMTLEEGFGLTIPEEQAEKFKMVSDVIAHVKANAKVPANLPEIPPGLAKQALMAPRFFGGKGAEFDAGTAFVAEASPGQPLLLTAQHLFGPDGGLEKPVLWSRMDKEYPKAEGVLIGSKDVGASGSSVLLLPGAHGMDDNSAEFDLAAYKLDGAPKADVLKLAKKDARVGDIVYMNSHSIGWTPAEVVSVEKTKLVYRYFLPGNLQGTSGAPVVNAEGEVVAMNLGGWTEKSTFGIGNRVESIRKLLSEAKK